jgi:hypothetical protein
MSGMIRRFAIGFETNGQVFSHHEYASPWSVPGPEASLTKKATISPFDIRFSRSTICFAQPCKILGNSSSTCVQIV